MAAQVDSENKKASEVVDPYHVEHDLNPVIFRHMRGVSSQDEHNLRLHRTSLHQDTDEQIHPQLTGQLSEQKMNESVVRNYDLEKKESLDSRRSQSEHRDALPAKYGKDDTFESRDSTPTNFSSAVAEQQAFKGPCTYVDSSNETTVDLGHDAQRCRDSSSEYIVTTTPTPSTSYDVVSSGTAGGATRYGHTQPQIDSNSYTTHDARENLPSILDAEPDGENQSSPLVVEAVRSDDSPFPCPLCPMRFRTAELRNRHEDSKHYHRFTCMQCTRAFNLRADLARHNRTVHKDVNEELRTYQCSNAKCMTPEKTFYRKDNFMRHVERCRTRIESKMEQ